MKKSLKVGQIFQPIQRFFILPITYRRQFI